MRTKRRRRERRCRGLEKEEEDDDEAPKEGCGMDAMAYRCASVRLELPCVWSV